MKRDKLLINQMIGKRIKERRAFFHFNRSFLAEKLGINPKQLTDYEEGKLEFYPSTLSRFAHELFTEISELTKDIDAELTKAQLSQENTSDINASIEEAGKELSKVKNPELQLALIKLLKELNRQ